MVYVLSLHDLDSFSVSKPTNRKALAVEKSGGVERLRGFFWLLLLVKLG